MRCGLCDATVPDSAIWCPKCGGAPSPRTPAVVEQARRDEANRRVEAARVAKTLQNQCVACSHQLSASAAWCPHCGHLRSIRLQVILTLGSISLAASMVGAAIYILAAVVRIASPHL